VYALRAGAAAWGFQMQGKAVTLLDQAASPTESNVCLSTDAESMILLTVGRADATEKLHSAALTLTGNVEQGKQFCATLFRPY
jgi:predicted lipid carrier protein YhbT